MRGKSRKTYTSSASAGDDASTTINTSGCRESCPWGYYALHFGYEAFGRKEFGSRVVSAIIGTATVALVFLMMVRVSGYAAAFGTSLLIAFGSSTCCIAR